MLGGFRMIFTLLALDYQRQIDLRTWCNHREGWIVHKSRTRTTIPSAQEIEGVCASIYRLEHRQSDGLVRPITAVVVDVDPAVDVSVAAGRVNSDLEKGFVFAVLPCQRAISRNEHPSGLRHRKYALANDLKTAGCCRPAQVPRCPANCPNAPPSGAAMPIATHPKP